MAKYLKEIGFVSTIGFLLIFGFVIQRSIAPSVFPVYFIYLALGLAVFVIFSQIDFEILSAFSLYGYIASLIFLVLPMALGQVTRGAVRWISIGEFTIQPAEVVRPFLLIFFTTYLAKKELAAKRVVVAGLLFLVPLGLILIQPSLGVAALTFIGLIGIVLSLQFNKRVLLTLVAISLALAPFAWFVLAPYQKARVQSLISPAEDPTGAGYNSIQSMISVGDGRFWGRGLGQGVQTQLSFLPERHTDFIFAAIAEELGFVGAALIILGSFYLLYRVAMILEKSITYRARAFVSGVFLTLFSQTVVHIGMNMGILPITGITLPLVSAGGSSLLATMAMLGMVLSAKDD